LARSSARGRGPGGVRAARPEPARTEPGPSPGARPPRASQGFAYRPLTDPAPARPLFDFAAAPWPHETPAFAWGAWTMVGPERLVAAVLAERAGSAALLHGPVVATEDGPGEPLEVAADLLAVLLDHAGTAGVVTLYARPQGLDRIWVRFGFIPVPEVALPQGLAGRAGVGLYAWRGGSALWSLREAD